MTLEDTLAFAYYQGLTSFINAALKLVRIGQITCQKILSDALKQCSKVVNKSKDISIVRDIQHPTHSNTQHIWLLPTWQHRRTSIYFSHSTTCARARTHTLTLPVAGAGAFEEEPPPSVDGA